MNASTTHDTTILFFGSTSDSVIVLDSLAALPGFSIAAVVTQPPNPEIVKKSHLVTDGIPERSNKLEGCLSIPNVWGKVHRVSTLTLQYQDEKGEQRKEAFSGFLATIIQHETDHINGILFTQRVLEQKEKLFQVTSDENGEELLEEIKFT